MKRFRMLNPARRVVGRVFLWFWATFIVAALLAVWVGRTFVDNIEIGTPEDAEIASLERAAERLSSTRRTPPLRLMLERSSRFEKALLVAVERGTGEIVQGNGPPLRPKERMGIKRLVEQLAPIAFTSRGFRVVGPQRLTYHNSDIALFLVRPQGPGDNNALLITIVVVAVLITMLLSYLFARHLVTPVLQVQRSARELAEGNWKARVSGATQRQDEIGQLGRDFNQMASQLEKMWTGQQRLLADISHELRSPLTRLQMALGLAWQQNIDNETLTRIERETERMDTLIGQLLQLTRAEGNKAERHPVAIHTLLQDLFSDAEFEASNIQKKVIIASLPEFTVCVDSEMVRRAVENVLRNALHYASAEVKVSIDVTENQWCVVVCDDGPGLPVEECEHIFMPFYRPSQARDRASGGVGLGLAIAKAAVQMHDGSVHALPGESGGLCVTLCFPVNG